MPTRLLTILGFGRAPMRVTFAYAMFGLLWIFLSDGLLAWLDYTDDVAFLVSAVKGAAFVLVTAVLLLWLVRREMAALQQSENLLRAVVEGTMDAVYVKDRNGRHLMVNRAAAGFVGRPVADVIGRTAHELFETADADHLNDLDRAVMDGGEVVTFEETLTSDGVSRTYLATKAPYRDACGIVIGLIGVSRDITERNRMEVALRESEQRWRQLADAIPQIVWTAAPDGVLTHLNAQAGQYSGLSPEAILGWSWQSTVHPDDWPRTEVSWTQTLTTGVPHDIEFRLRRADGEYRWHVSRQVPVRAADGTIERWYGTCTDIHDLKQTANALRETDARLREAQRIARLGSWSWEPLTDHVWWSDAEFELFGVPVGSIVPSFEAFLACLHPDDRPVAVARVEAMRSGANEFADDLQIVRPNGEMIWIHSRARATRDAAGVLVRVEGIDQDITAQRLAREALRESEQMLQSAVAVAGLGVHVIDYDRQMVDLSPHAAEQFGFSPETKIALADLHARFHSDDRAELARLTAAALDPAGTGWFALEHRVARPDGSVRWLSIRKQVSFAYGRPQRAVVVTIDVTDRRLAEASLRASEERYRLLFEANPHPMWVYDVNSLQFRAVNDAAILAYGYSRDEFLAMTLRDIRPAEEVPKFEAAVALPAPGVRHFGHLRHRRKDGTVFDVEVSRHDFQDGDSRSGLVLALDVSERTRAERELRESEDRLRLALAVGGLGTWDVDLRTGRVVWSDDHYAMHGYVAGEVPHSYQAWLDRVHPDDRAASEAALASARESREAFAFDFRAVHPDGNVRWLSARGRFFYDEAGTPVRMIGVGRDVTDQRLAADALRASEERLLEATRVAEVGVFEHDHQTGADFWSTRLRNIMGYDLAAPAALTEYLAMVHPDDLDAITAAVNRAHDPTGDGRFDVMHRLIRPADGRVVWLTMQSQTHFDGEGPDRRPVRTVGATVDVTEARERVEALRVSEARYRRLLDVLPTAVFVHSDNRVVYGNPAFLSMMGAATPEEVLGRSPFDIAHPSSHDTLRLRQQEMARTGIPLPGCDMLAVRLDGRPVPVYVVAAPIDGYGWPASLIVLSDMTERERSTALLRSVLSSVGDAILTIDSRGAVTSANLTTERLFGYAEAELLGRNVNILMHEPHRGHHDRYIADYLQTGVARVIGVGREVDGRRKDGTTFPAELTVTEFAYDGERHFTGVIRDISARRKLEEQFRQAQKMEAIGRLAGGVAHDFNNLLTVINGYADMLLADLPVGATAREPLAAIIDAGEQAARLTQQLLAFSRTAIVQTKVLDLNDLVSESAKLLRRLIGEHIVLIVVTSPTPVLVKADPCQLEQVIMNLAVNARDAMPTGGRLTIETTVVPMNGDTTQFVCLAVSDTGHGIADDAKGKIFEPFFTTKSVGEGTGLGLAVVYGVVEQCGGKITVESVVGVGTTFRILLPLVAGDTNSGAKEFPGLPLRGDETLLLVEDEAAVRKFVRVALETQGYRVLEAGGAAEAVRYAETHQGSIDLLISDVVMPEIGGQQLLHILRQHRHGLRVLFMSGYTDDAVLLHGVAGATDAFIQKPFTPLDLARRVRDVIDAPA